jgi:NADPH2:quinone reductase
MKAVAVRAFRATPEVMDLPRPVPGPTEVLVRMAAAGVNPLDWKVIDGFYDGRRPHVFPLVLGVDGAGWVEGVGADVTRFRVGDPICGQFLHSPVGTGTFTEYTTVPESIGVSPFPADIGPTKAAALPTSGMTALSGLERMGLRRGSSLLLVGASGGVGSFATSLASALGYHVSAVIRSGSADRMRELGATEIFTSDPDIPVDQIRAAHPGGFDGLLDVVSDAAGLTRLASLVRRGGSVATTRHVADPAAAQAMGMTAFNADLDPSSALLDRLLKQVAEHHLPIPVEREISLAEVPAALEESRRGHGTGKTVVVISR